VWGIDLVAIGLAAGLDLAWGFLAVYLTLINAVVHLLAGIVSRESNAGLVTAVALFLPVGGVAWWTLERATGLGVPGHLLFAGLIVLEHALIVAWVVTWRGRASAGGAWQMAGTDSPSNTPLLPLPTSSEADRIDQSTTLD